MTRHKSLTKSELVIFLAHWIADRLNPVTEAGLHVLMRQCEEHFDIVFNQKMVAQVKFYVTLVLSTEVVIEAVAEDDIESEFDATSDTTTH